MKDDRWKIIGSSSFDDNEVGDGDDVDVLMIIIIIFDRARVYTQLGVQAIEGNMICSSLIILDLDEIGMNHRREKAPGLISTQELVPSLTLPMYMFDINCSQSVKITRWKPII